LSKGIDIPIDSLVADFNAALWTGKNNQFYGRVFRNERFEDFGSKISPEVWISSNEPAVEVLKDNNYDAQCFFDVQPIEGETIGDVHSVEVWICFMLDLLAVYPSLTRQQATEQAHMDTEELILDSAFENPSLVRGFTGFTGYDWGNNADQAKADMHPHYCFRFSTNLNYTNC
jgi:hypothetical protein